MHISSTTARCTGAPASVEWLPWDVESLALARRSGKPILLLIGAPTCGRTALLLDALRTAPDAVRCIREAFVPIRIDQAERPDLTRLYIDLLTVEDSCGAPWVLLLTPDLAPFLRAGGERMQKTTSGEWAAILAQAATAWQRDQGAVIARAARVTEALHARATASAEDPGATCQYGRTLATGARALKAAYDADEGGFTGRSPRRPDPAALDFLLRYHHRTGDTECLDMVVATIEALAAGAIHDHLGGGLHAYATSGHWGSPSFEKTLVDQADLIRVCIAAWQTLGVQSAVDLAGGLREYLLRDLTSATGGFYCAEGDDAEGRATRFYTWTATELAEALGPDCAATFGRAFGIGGIHAGPVVPRRPRPTPALSEELELARRRLRAVRDHRPRPPRDERFVTAWNGRAIAALATAGHALNDELCLRAARAAAEFAQHHLQHKGRLLRCSGGPVRSPGFLADYADLGLGLLALYEATFEPVHLAHALHLAREMVRLFARSDGRFSLTGTDVEPPLAPLLDPEEASASAVQLLLRLGHAVGDGDLVARGRAAVRACQARAEASPRHHPALLCALDEALGPFRRIVLTGYPSDPAVRRWQTELGRHPRPNSVLVFRPDLLSGEAAEIDRDAQAEQRLLSSLIPDLEDHRPVGGTATVHVWRNQVRRPPVQDPAALARELAA